MMRLIRGSFAVLVTVAMVSITGCGGSSGGLSPIAPSVSAPAGTAAPPPPGPTTSAGASIEGNVTVGVTALPAWLRALNDGLTVSIVGTNIVSQVAQFGYFKLDDVPSGDIEIEFSGSGVDARISVDAVEPQEHIEITVTVSGSSASVDTRQRATDLTIDLDGRILSIDSSRSSIRIGEVNVSVPPGASIRQGSRTLNFADLRVDDRVHVRGRKEGTLVLAEQIEVQVEVSVELYGTVSGLTGACPSLHFVLNDVAVSTGSTTEFKTPCSDVQHGAKARVIGTRQPEGVRASRVSVDKPEPPKPTETTLTGTVANLAGACPALTFTVDGTPASTNASTTYGGDGACADIKNGDRRSLVGTKQSDGRVLARYVTGASAPPTSEVTLSGTVASLSGTCPSLSFTVNGTAVSTNASTTFSPGACSDVKNGGTLGLVGTKQSDGHVLARAVSVAKSETPHSEITLTGPVANLAGTCPSLTFTLDGTPASTNASTTYGGGGACGDIKNADRRSLVGTKQSDGRVLARYVTGASAPPTSEVTLSGTVASLSGTCPSLSFIVNGSAASTNASTTFSPGACSDVKNGATLGLVGTKQSDGRVLARAVSVAKSETPHSEITVSGTVSSLAGTCPSLTFTVDTTPAATNASTTYGGGTCGGIKNGGKLGLAGTKQSDGRVLARYVSVQVSK